MDRDNKKLCPQQQIAHFRLWSPRISRHLNRSRSYWLKWQCNSWRKEDLVKILTFIFSHFNWTSCGFFDFWTISPPLIWNSYCCIIVMDSASTYHEEVSLEDQKRRNFMNQSSIHSFNNTQKHERIIRITNCNVLRNGKVWILWDGWQSSSLMEICGLRMEKSWMDRVTSTARMILEIKKLTKFVFVCCVHF